MLERDQRRRGALRASATRMCPRRSMSKGHKSVYEFFKCLLQWSSTCGSTELMLERDQRRRGAMRTSATRMCPRRSMSKGHKSVYECFECLLQWPSTCGSTELMLERDQRRRG